MTSVKNCYSCYDVKDSSDDNYSIVSDITKYNLKFVVIRN